MNRSAFIFVLAGIFVFVLTGCGGSGKSGGGGTKKFTSRSGWKPNDQKGWFFTGKKDKEKAWHGMVLVEGGSFTMGNVKTDVMRDWNNTPRRMQVRTFYLGDSEVTNYEYKEYMAWIAYVFPSSDPNNKIINDGILPDTAVWANRLSRNDIFVNEYLRNPSFDYYPVVGVSWLQAERYCEWLTNRANERAMMDKGFINKDLYLDESVNLGANHFDTERFKQNPDEVFQGTDVIDTTKMFKSINVKNPNPRINYRTSMNSNLVAKFRLPTEAEWEFAALALTDDREYNLYQEKQVAGYNIRKERGRNRGDFIDNFKRGRGDYSGIGGWGNDGSAITNDVRKYPANPFGLYGMMGNVAEWTADVYRPIIDDEANDFNYFRGNIYTRRIENEQGGYETIQEGELTYDTLNTGQLLARGLPGQYRREVIEDARNYRDGDYQSSLDMGNDEVDPTDTNDAMYNSPVRNFVVDDQGRVIMERDEQQRFSEISKGLRVVKGGSWADDIFWLDAGQRRYHHEASAAAWIGFRVAQDYTGNEEMGSKRSKRGA
ncbi:MAG: gliding motility lipoprotein GldJ [Weeksellaceae bacterium]|nr:gliding motility lipoprotein GldJ [Weeksellaceae bacterium]